MAILVAGAGSAYLSGGLGAWEFAFAAVTDGLLAVWFVYGAPTVGSRR